MVSLGLHKTSSGALTRPHQDLLGVPTWPHQSRSGPPRSVHVASSELSKTHLEHSHGFTRTSLECPHGSIRPPQSVYAAQSEPLKTSSRDSRGFIKGTHVAFSGPPGRFARSVIRSVQDLLNGTTWPHQDRSRPPARTFREDLHENFFKAISCLLKRYDRLMVRYYRVTVIPTFSW